VRSLCGTYADVPYIWTWDNAPRGLQWIPPPDAHPSHRRRYKPASPRVGKMTAGVCPLPGCPGGIRAGKPCRIDRPVRPARGGPDGSANGSETTALTAGKAWTVIAAAGSWIFDSWGRSRPTPGAYRSHWARRGNDDALDADADARLRTRPADELGLDPSPELQTLHARILRAEPALLTGAPPQRGGTGPGPRDVVPPRQLPSPADPRRKRLRGLDHQSSGARHARGREPHLFGRVASLRNSDDPSDQPAVRAFRLVACWTGLRWGFRSSRHCWTGRPTPAGALQWFSGPGCMFGTNSPSARTPFKSPGGSGIGKVRLGDWK
jgi:hypothetical protein